MKYYVIDVFTDELFKGNPAGVCVLDEWLDDITLQKISFENNLSETAFLIKKSDYYELRWFTPSIEIDLCGHATLASAYVLFKYYEKEVKELIFETASGIMKVSKDGELLSLDFPSRPATITENYTTFEKAFKVKSEMALKAVDFLIVYKDEQTVRNIKPDFSILKKLNDEAKLDNDYFGIIITAPGDNCDFVSRFFAPNLGINEDPVTGRAHCTLIPYWSDKLNKTTMTAEQLSNRGGHLICEAAGHRVKISGKAVCYLIGDIQL